MAFNVTILQLNDETSNAVVEYEDTSSLVTFRQGIYMPEEFVTESDMLDYIALHWPYPEFVVRGKAPANRHTTVKGVLGVPKNITGRVLANDPTKLNFITVPLISVPKGIGITQQFLALGQYNDTHTEDLTAIATWVSSDPAVATIDAAGLATGVSAGTTDITAAFDGETSNIVVLTIT